jgi:hypothetical protein
VNAFHVFGALFARWPIVLAGLGITRSDFPAPAVRPWRWARCPSCSPSRRSARGSSPARSRKRRGRGDGPAASRGRGRRAHAWAERRSGRRAAFDTRSLEAHTRAGDDRDGEPVLGPSRRVNRGPRGQPGGRDGRPGRQIHGSCRAPAGRVRLLLLGPGAPTGRNGGDADRPQSRSAVCPRCPGVANTWTPNFLVWGTEGR